MLKQLTQEGNADKNYIIAALRALRVTHSNWRHKLGHA